jgi:hypothetical protein
VEDNESDFQLHLILGEFWEESRRFKMRIGRRQPFWTPFLCRKMQSFQMILRRVRERKQAEQCEGTMPDPLIECPLWACRTDVRYLESLLPESPMTAIQEIDLVLRLLDSWAEGEWPKRPDRQYLQNYFSGLEQGFGSMLMDPEKARTIALRC